MSPSIWIGEMIDKVFWPVDRDLVWGIPLSAGRRDDILVWHYDHKGIYSVRSGYRIEMEERRLAGCSNRNNLEVWWNKLWGLNVPSKIKIHVWRAFHEALPVRSHLCRRGNNVDQWCSGCQKSVEDCTHSLLLCVEAKEMWEETILWPVLNAFPGGPFSSLCSFVSDRSNREELGIFCMLVWSLWVDRNLLVF